MKVYQSKLIVLRGNSGSGKTTVAHRLRDGSKHKTAIVSQDVIRREILPPDQPDDATTIALLMQVTEFALARDYHVVLEGILSFQRYGDMLNELTRSCPEHYFYYFDIPLEETLRRDASREIRRDHGVEAMRSWYRPHDLTNFTEEKTITESISLEQTVQMILVDTKLVDK